MSIKNIKTFLIAIFIVVILLFIILVIVNITNPKFNIITCISALSTFSVAILTVFYVYNTSVQLNVMNKQLDEMKMERELQHQPLPWILNLKTYIEKPRFFYTPIEDEYIFKSRYNVNISLKNIGTYPSVFTDVSAQLCIYIEKNKLCILNSVDLRVDTLEEKQIYPSSESKDNSFRFNTDNEGLFIKSLIEEGSKNPYFKIRILFRNTLGACFVLYNSYVINANRDSESILKEWLSSMKTFPVKFINELNTLMNLREKNREKWDELFNKVKDEVTSSLENSKDVIELLITPIPNTFELKTITLEEYEDMTKKLSYTIPYALLKGNYCC